MANEAQSKRITVTLDGMKVEAEERETVLSLARRFGVHIPTLCHLDALEPAGACRVCLVEARQGEWQKYVTACNYPLWDGLEIRTDSEQVLALRRLTLEALLARCPKVPAIQKLAKSLGVGEPRFVPNDDTCILCGLCTRVCETYVTSAIAMQGRGERKEVGTFAGEPPEDCVGCGACAAVCPTNHIEVQRGAGTYTIWGQEHKVATCVVDNERCRACGSCEQACPFRVPRLSLRRGGEPVMEIDVTSCRGCGVCLAACPTAAISQPRAKRGAAVVTAGSDQGRALVIACTRADLNSGESRKNLPERVDVVELPCSGGFNMGQALGALARGYDGVLVLGRHQATCRLDGAEEHAKDIAHRAEQLATLVGLGRGRVAFVEPLPGKAGPAEAVRAFASQLPRSPLGGVDFSREYQDSLDGAIEALKYLSSRIELVPDGSVWLAGHNLEPAVPGHPAVIAAAIPYLDLLYGGIVADLALPALLQDSVAVLARLGIQAGVAVGGLGHGFDRLITRTGATAYYSNCPGCADELGKLGANVQTVEALLLERGAALELGGAGLGTLAISQGDANKARLVRALCAKHVEIAPPPPFSLSPVIDHRSRAAFEARLAQSAEQGAALLLVSGPGELVQHHLIVRQGSWRKTHVRPALAVTLAAQGLTHRHTA